MHIIGIADTSNGCSKRSDCLLQNVPAKRGVLLSSDNWSSLAFHVCCHGLCCHFGCLCSIHHTPIHCCCCLENHIICTRCAKWAQVISVKLQGDKFLEFPIPVRQHVGG